MVNIKEGVMGQWVVASLLWY